MNNKKYSHTVGKNHQRKQIGVSKEAPEFVDSLVILLDKINSYVPFESEMLQLIFSVLPEEEKADLFYVLQKKAGSDEQIDRFSIKNIRAARLIRMIEGEVEDKNKFYRENGRPTINYRPACSTKPR